MMDMQKTHGAETRMVEVSGGGEQCTGVKDGGRRKEVRLDL